MTASREFASSVVVTREALGERAVVARWPASRANEFVRQLAIAATGTQGVRVAAKHGQTWVTTGDRTRTDLLPAVRGAAVVREQMARLDDACTEINRDPKTIGRLVLTGALLDAGLASVEAFRDTAGHYADAGVTDFVVHWPRTGGPYAADLSTFERAFSS